MWSVTKIHAWYVMVKDAAVTVQPARITHSNVFEDQFLLQLIFVSDLTWQEVAQRRHWRRGFYSCKALPWGLGQTRQDTWKSWSNMDGGQCVGHSKHVSLTRRPTPLYPRAKTPATWTAFTTSRSLLWSQRGWVWHVKLQLIRLSSCVRSRPRVDFI